MKFSPVFTKLSLAAAFVVGISSAPAFALNLISNGGFETPNLGYTGPGTQAFQTVPNGTSGLDWQGGGGASAIDLYTSDFLTFCCGPGGNVPFKAFQGNQFAEVNRDGTTNTVFQSFIADPGLTAISFALAGRGSQNTTTVTVTDALSNTLFTQLYTAPEWAWEVKSGVFNSPGGQLTLTFTGASSIAGQGALLDAVSAEAVVPGPLPLFGAGVAFGFSRRIRRRISKPSA